MKKTELLAVELPPAQPIAELVDGMFIDLEHEIDRVFEANQSKGLDTNLLRRIVYTHRSRSQESLTVLLKILDAHQKGYLDNMLILTLAVTT